VRTWDVETGLPLKTMRPHIGMMPGAIAYSPNGELLAVGHRMSDPQVSTDFSVPLFNQGQDKPLRRLLGNTSGVESLTFDPSGKLLAGGANDGRVVVWNVSTGEVVRSWQCARSAGVIAFLNRSSQILTKEAAGPFAIRNLVSGLTERTFDVPRSTM